MSTDLSATERIVVRHFRYGDHAPESSPLCTDCAGDGAWIERVDETSDETVWIVCATCAGAGKPTP